MVEQIKTTQTKTATQTKANDHSKSIVKRLGKNTLAVILILCGLFVIIIVYAVVMFELYKKKTFIFTPYVPVKPSDAFFPLGKITPMTQEEIDERNEFIYSFIPTPPN